MTNPIKLGVALMVKNESRVIERCLMSVLPVADHIVITDTGSTDDTIAKAGLFLQNHGIKYNIYSEPFVDFAHNRNRLLELCANHKDLDYILMIDADDVLEYDNKYDKAYFKTQLYSDFCDIKHTCGDSFFYHLPKLTKNSINITYVGVTHEYLETRHYSGYINSYIWINQLNDGYRRQTNSKLTQDIELLEKQPHQTAREIFYLAETYRGIGNYGKASQNYLIRTKMGEWDEEIFYSYYQLGKINEILDEDELMVGLNYYRAYKKCPFRAESLYALFNYYYKKDLGYLGDYIKKLWEKIPKPNSGLFIEEDKYAISNTITPTKN